jgi:hypothetical protein
LEDLAECLQGSTRVFKEDGAYFLESELLSELLDDGSSPTLYQQAKDFLRVISGVERVRRAIAEPVELNALYWKDSGTTWGQVLGDTVTLTFFSNIVRLSDSGVFERSVELALGDEQVRMNLNDFLGEWDFPRLRRIAESIFIDVGAGDVKRGVQEVIDRGWVSAQDCALFRDTVNYGDGKTLGAHSRLKRSPVQNPMNIIQAGEFLGGIFAKWIESKI